VSLSAWTGVDARALAFLHPDQLSRASLVLRMARVATCTHSLTVILQAILAEMARDGLRAGLIALVDQYKGLHIAASEGDIRPQLVGREFRPGEGILGRVAASGRSVVIPDLDAPGATATSVLTDTTPRLRSMAVVPVRAGRSIVALLELDATVPNAFNEGDLGLLEDIALAISGSIQAVRLQSLHDRLDNAERVIFSLARAVEAKDIYTEAHTERVARTSRALGESAGVSGADLDNLYRGGMIHDIGKIGVPDAILLKPAALTAPEFDVIRRHPLVGEEIARPLRSAASLLSIIRHHHERIDGRGYPDGLKGEQIPLLARIVSICDAFDAMISDRPYRRGRSHQEAIDVLRHGSGTQWDARLVEIFVKDIAGAQSLLLATPSNGSRDTAQAAASAFSVESKSAAPSWAPE
jgi:HD-GYP domain-containing protein (c-di-GMP phosphodiesterase class II)